MALKRFSGCSGARFWFAVRGFAGSRVGSQLLAPSRKRLTARRAAPSCAPKNPWASPRTGRIVRTGFVFAHNGTGHRARRELDVSVTPRRGRTSRWTAARGAKRSRRADVDAEKREEPEGISEAERPIGSKLVDRRWSGVRRRRTGGATRASCGRGRHRSVFRRAESFATRVAIQRGRGRQYTTNPRTCEPELEQSSTRQPGNRSSPEMARSQSRCGAVPRRRAEGAVHLTDSPADTATS